MARLVFFGNERLATAVTTDAPVLRALIGGGHELAAVVVNHHAASSRRARELEVEAVAREHGIPVLAPERPADITNDLKQLEAELGVLVAYGRLVPTSVMELFPRGIINLHPSLLPRHRGPIPIEAVILEGAAETGVSVMQLSAAMDAGPIWNQAKLPVAPDISKQALADRLADLGADLILQTISAVTNGSAAPAPQDEAQATCDERLTKADGRLDWSKPAARLEREVRAYLGWPGSSCELGGHSLTVTAAHADPGPAGAPGTVQTAGKRLAVATADGWLAIDRLKPAAGREMDAAAFLAGHPF